MVQQTKLIKKMWLHNPLSVLLGLGRMYHGPNRLTHFEGCTLFFQAKTFLEPYRSTPGGLCNPIFLTSFVCYV